MQIQTDFSKMQCLLIGNRFSGLNLSKTRYDFDVQQSTKIKGISLSLILTITVDYLEKDDSVKYLQHATIDIPDEILNSADTLQFLKDAVIEIQNELIRRYETSKVFEFLELKDATDRLTYHQLNERLSRIISDYDNGKL